MTQTGNGRNGGVDRSNDDEEFGLEKSTLTILNLRGDANNFPLQVELLSHISDLMVVCIDADSLQKEEYHQVLRKIHGSDSRCLLVTEVPFSKVNILQSYITKMQIQKENTSILSLFDRKRRRKLNTSETRKNLSLEISKLLAKVGSVKSLEEQMLNKKHCLTIDEETNECREGKTLAIALFSQLKSTESFLVKDDFLPLQGKKFWHAWSKKQKESNRSGQRETYDETEKLDKDMQNLRREQIEEGNQTNSFIANFVRVLYEHHQHEGITMFFLSWLKQMLDEQSRKVLPKHQLQFKHVFNRFAKAANEREKEEMKEQLDTTEQNLADASCGLELCFREIAQIYEAFISETSAVKTPISENTMIILMHLPIIVAKLALLGMPLELMDGDAANVPLIWMKDVFGAMKNLFDFKVCSISVLGIQSSGKSTLLNAMFGLQFAVSAGRCTRGVYSQFLRVDRSKSSLPFDYAMIIDSEGLRAPELADEKFHHDNELATFVIGLGDYVIINIKGENMADMENVLQIVVHGLLRLKQANNELQLTQSCTFVHQNVSATDAAKQMQQGHRKIMQNLDDMTKEVANQEHMSHVTSFRDVIAFDPTKPGTIQYMADLWHGSPPLAPCSAKYSENVTAVACNILNDTKSFRRGLSIGDVFQHLQNLWNGILKEDFVFSFRNTLEVKAYNLLDAKFQQCAWLVEKKKLEWLNKNIKPKFGKCENKDELRDCFLSLSSDIDQIMNSQGSIVKKEVQKFMNESDFQNHMIHWRESKLRSIDTLVEELKSDMHRRVREARDQFELDLNSRNLLDRKEKEINIHAQKLAHSLKGKHPTEKELRERFEQMWNEWFEELSANISETPDDVKKKDLKTAMKSTLFKIFNDHCHLVQGGLDSCDLDQGIALQELTGTFKVKQKHLNIKRKLWTKMKKAVGIQDYKSRAKREVADIFDELDEKFELWSTQDAECGSTELSHLIRTLRERFKIYNAREQGCTANHIMMVDVALHVSRHAFRKFTLHNESFFKQHSVKEKLQKFKPKALKIFYDTVAAKTKEVIAAKILCMELKELVSEKVRRDITDLTVGTMKSKFSFLKFHLLKDILMQLGTEPNFDQYMQYIHNPRRYALLWFRNSTEAELFEIQQNAENTKFQEWTKTCVTVLMEKITVAVDKMPGHPKSMADWLSGFRKNIDEYHLALTSSSFSHVRDCDVRDFENFCACVREGLHEQEAGLLNEFRSMDSETVRWERTRPYDEIFESLWGCGETCPWCAEPCQYNRNHSSETEPHRCIQHKPAGINGIHHKETKKIAIETCNFQVQSTSRMHCGSWCKACKEEDCQEFHPYIEYKKYIPEWDIAPRSNMSGSKYWTWFMTQYNNDLAKRYELEPAVIPDSFLYVSRKVALDSLSEYVGMVSE